MSEQKKSEDGEGNHQRPTTPTSIPDTLRTLRFRAWAALVRRASSGRFWHGFAVRLAAVWTPAGDAFLVSSGQPMQRKCTTIQTTNSGGCSHQRTLLVPVVSLVELSTEPSHEVSCGRRDSAIGFAFNRRSWSAGSAKRNSHRSLAS